MRQLLKISMMFLFLLNISCVQEAHLKTITFKVDVNGVSDITSVGIKGEFTDPQWKVTVPLEDLDGDGVYEVTLSQETAQPAVEFKFVVNETYELLQQPNRKITMEYKPEILLYEAIFDQPQGKQTRLK